MRKNKYNTKIKGLTLAVCIALMPTPLWALGLGKLNVLSNLGEPLNANIEITSATPQELSTLAANIASESAYAAQGVNRPALHNNIQVSVTKNAKDAPVLKLKTNQSVNDPFLDMLIQLNWANGSLLREYTALLDPPGYSAQSSSLQPSNVEQSAVAQPIVQPQTNSNDIGHYEHSADQSVANSKINKLTTLPKDEAYLSTNDKNLIAVPGQDNNQSKDSDWVTGATNRTQKKSNAVKHVVSDTKPVVINGSQNQHTTETGDTLSSVANQMQVEGVSLDQMLVALYEANPDAFSGHNMNRLKVGEILQAPSPEVLNSIDNAAARKVVKVHAKNWRAYRNQLAGLVHRSRSNVENTVNDATAGSVTVSASKPNAQGDTTSKDVVKLSAGDMSKATSTSTTKTAKETQASSQEDKIAKDKSEKEASERADLLKKQADDMRKLLEIKNNPMTDVQNATGNTPPVRDENFLDNMISSVKNLFGGVFDNIDGKILQLAGAVLAALLGGWLYLRHKKNKNLSEFEDSKMAAELNASTTFSDTAINGHSSATSFLTGFTQNNTEGVASDAHDVDPIAEADIYIAYDREDQAEEILKDAILKEPKRYELHTKLLELYAKRKKNSAFDSIANELYTTLGVNHPVWAKVAALGATLEPDNPMYKGHGLVATPLASANKLDETVLKQPLENSHEHFEDKSLLVSNRQHDVHHLDFDLNELDKLNVGNSNKDVTRSAHIEDVNDATKELESAINHEPKVNREINLKEKVLVVPEATASLVEKSNKLDLSRLDFEVPDFLHDKKTLSQVGDIDFDHHATDFSNESFSNKLAQADDRLKTENVKPFDLSGIDLNLNNHVNDFSTDKSAIQHADAQHSSTQNTDQHDGQKLKLDDFEQRQAPMPDQSSHHAPTDAETKLYLVAAYLDMEDKEGAVELLEEVLKEGNADQKARAKALLTSIV